MATDETPIIDLSDVRLTLESDAGPVNILRGIDMALMPGQAVGLVGPSGSGKSSLMMVIAGLEQASSGRVQVAGRDITGLGEDALATFRREAVGIVFQAFHLVPTMTALENVAVPLELAGQGNAFSRAESALESVGLADRLTHYPGQLSGGEQQRVAIARAFVTEPRVLLADEPTGNLDGDTGGTVIELLFSLQRAHGTTLLLITHDSALAARCDRVVRMNDGLVSDAAPAALAAAGGHG